ncbi:MAG TPA: flippase [Candidatus Jorgensenbacteria bacterium]|nr:flippase [Candidatus Jorgensenbacteria bacterium]
MSKIKDFLFKNKNVKQIIAKNVFWLGVGQVGSRIIRAFIIIYAARLLGAAEYGVFSYALGLAGFFTVFADIGLSPILTREVAKKPGRGSYYFATTFWMKIILLAVTSLLVIFLAPQFSGIEAAKAIVPFVALLVIFDGVRDLTIAFVRAKNKMEIEALIIVITNIAITVFGFIILYFSATAKAFTLSYVASAGIGTIAAIFILKEEFMRVVSNFRKQLIRPLIKSALPIALFSIFGIFMINIDIIMLGWFRSAEEIGFYSGGLRIVQLLYILPSIIAVSIFPSLSKLIGENNHEKAKKLMEKVITVVLLMAFPIAVGGVILGFPLIEIVFGAEYLPGVNAFKILIVAIIFVFVGNVLGNSILAYDLQRKMTKFVVGSAIANVALNFILIPIYGIVGAAIATFAVQVFYNFFLIVIIKKVNKFLILKYLKKIIVAAVIMGIFTFIINWLGIHVILNIITSALVYFAVLLILKESTVNELKLIALSIKK